MFCFVLFLLFFFLNKRGGGGAKSKSGLFVNNRKTLNEVSERKGEAGGGENGVPEVPGAVSWNSVLGPRKQPSSPLRACWCGRKLPSVNLFRVHCFSVYVHTYTCPHACGMWKPEVGIRYLNCSLPCFLRWSLSLNLGLSSLWLDWLARDHQASACLPPSTPSLSRTRQT